VTAQPWRVVLLVPEVEAFDVKLKALVVGGADRFHEELVGPDEFLAGVALFPRGRTTPNARDTVVWQTARCELTTDEEAENLLVHGLLGYRRQEARPDSPES